VAALGPGLPQVCLPQGADQFLNFLNAAAVSSAGVGISFTSGEREADAVRDAIVRVLDDASFREAAGRVRSSIASMPSPDDVAEGLEALR
jgi:UDP:flavonoid glycosyltransferase YjiC (YdhE family)